VEGKYPWLDRILGIVVLAMIMVGVVVVVALTWRLIPNHVLAVMAALVLVPLFLWGLTQDE
jgi:hypothetical protein